VLESSASRITTEVPTGATTGRIRVTNNQGSAISSADFIVGDAPTLTSAVPDSGKVGAVIVLNGDHLLTTTQVAFGGTSNAPFTVLSDTQLRTTVDTHAMTGPVSVATIYATRTSSFTFRVLPPDPSARIVAIRDVPNDQGGKVTVAWLASDLDH